MAHESEIDLTTLRQVQEILSSTDFASIDDLATKSDLAELSASRTTARGAGFPAPLSSESLDPLPKRR